MTGEDVRAALELDPERCALCGLIWRAPGLCGHCRLVAGLRGVGPEAQWGWCRGRHRLATTQKDRLGRWTCLAHGGGRA
jgi:hypothetical protein